jgi:diadenosine tetraphosphatase ApaH/serine/threonine PP2A family protein phosphatase
VLVFGHTHKPWVHEFGGVLFVNCGSVGKPKDGDPRGAFAILRPAAYGVEVTIERVSYDAATETLGAPCRSRRPVPMHPARPAGRARKKRSLPGEQLSGSP